MEYVTGMLTGVALTLSIAGAIKAIKNYNKIKKELRDKGLY